MKANVQESTISGTVGPEDRRAVRALGANARALVLLALVLDVPLLSHAVRGLTREPRAHSVEVDGVPLELVRPAGRGPWPAFVFVTGAHPLRRNEPIVQRVAEGFARAGYLAVVPDLPGLGEGTISRGTRDAALSVVEWTQSRDDVRGGRVALCGASAGASLALLVAEHPELAGRISIVAAVCPFADLEKMLCLATTCRYEDDGRVESYEAAVLLRRVVARSVVAALPSAADREFLLDRIGDVTEDGRDPIHELRALEVGRLQPESRAVVELLTNSDPGRFRELYDALPTELHSLVDELSPLHRVGEIAAPVEFIGPPADPYFPGGETRALAAGIADARVTVSPILDHTRPSLSLSLLGDFARFRHFVVRTLADAAS